jgi:FKBP-type peptidyl-prolyl cis-trans isomerase 2
MIVKFLLIFACLTQPETAMSSFPSQDIEPGQWVRHPGRPDWGAGQVQSAIGTRVTVNFEHAGKVLVNTAVVQLEACDAPPD